MVAVHEIIEMCVGDVSRICVFRWCGYRGLVRFRLGGARWVVRGEGGGGECECIVGLMIVDRVLTSDQCDTQSMLP
jgi:hypothetical protein